MFIYMFSGLYQVHPVHKVLHLRYILECVNILYGVCCESRCVLVEFFSKRELAQEGKITFNVQTQNRKRWDVKACTTL